MCVKENTYRKRKKKSSCHFSHSLRMSLLTFDVLLNSFGTCNSLCGLCTYGSLVIDVQSLWNYWNLKNLAFSIFLVKQNQKNLYHSKSLNLIKDNHFSSNSNKNQTFFCFFTKNLTLSLPVTCCTGRNTDLPLNSNI